LRLSLTFMGPVSQCGGDLGEKGGFRWPETVQKEGSIGVLPIGPSVAPTVNAAIACCCLSLTA
jgi:hypothetical protein